MYKIDIKPNNVIACIDFNINNSNIESFGILLRYFDDKMLDIIQRTAMFIEIIDDSEKESKDNQIMKLHKNHAMTMLLFIMQFAGAIVIRSADDWQKIKNNIMYIATDETISEIELILEEGYNELFPLRKQLLSLPSFAESANALFPTIDLNYLTISEMYQATFGYEYQLNKIEELREVDMLGDIFNYLLNYCRESIINDWSKTQDKNPQIQIDVQYYQDLQRERKEFEQSVEYKCYLLARHYNDLEMLKEYRDNLENRKFDKLVARYEHEIEPREAMLAMPGQEGCTPETIGFYEMNNEAIMKHWQFIEKSNNEYLKRFVKHSNEKATKNVEVTKKTSKTISKKS